MTSTRGVTLGLASLAATLWAVAVVQLGLAVWTGLLPTPLGIEPRRAAGAMIIGLGQVVFVLAVADRMFPYASKPARRGLVLLLSGGCLVAAGWFAALVATEGITL